MKLAFMLPRPDFSVPQERFGELRPPKTPSKPRRPMYNDREVHIPDWKTSRVNERQFILFCLEEFGILVQVKTSAFTWANVVFESVNDKSIFMENSDEISRKFGDVKILGRY